MISKSIDIQKYRRDYVDTLSEEERQAIRQSHVERMQQGADIWNTWAKQVLAAIEQTYPTNATEAEKLAIRNQYQINFSGVNFVKLTSFSHFICPIKINFTQSCFHDSTSFSCTTFLSDADFYLAEFKSGYLFFGDVTFLGKVNFQEVKFQKDIKEVSFIRCKFKNSTNFTRVTCLSPISFKKAEFFCYSIFYRAKFDTLVNFDSSTFHSLLNFTDAYFKENVLLFNVTFLHTSLAIPCDFRQTYFYLPPLIDDFPSNLAQFIKANKRIKRNKNFYKNCEACFRALKQLAEKNNNHQKTLEFYGCELYCQRRAGGGLRNPKNWANYLYGLSSHYGLSLIRPAVLWFVVMFSSIYIQAHYEDRVSCCPETIYISWERLGFYAAPSMPPFVGKPLYQKEVRHRLYPADKTKPAGQLSTANRVIRTIQTLVTFISLFLIGLALRNRFKIG